MQIEARSPCRVDLAGGTMDIWPLYLYHRDAVTVNFAVSHHTSCRIVETKGRGITLRSMDQKIEEKFDSLDALRRAAKYKHALAAYVVKWFGPEQGVEVETDSEAPAGGGISGSSSMLISTVSAFNRLCGTGYSIEKVREVAQNIEAQIIKVPTGCQDYFPAMYGGVSAIELRVDGLKRVALPVDLEELNSRFLLAYTDKPRNSGINNWEVTKAHVDGDRRVRRNFDKIAAISHAMRGALTRGDWEDVSRLLREEWSFRRKNAPGITTPFIDELVAVTRKAGAKAAKVCGAGGGGCVVFLVAPGTKEKVAAAIGRAGAQVLPTTVAARGVKIQSRG